MENGDLGVRTRNVPSLVGEELKQEQGDVIIPLLLVVVIVALGAPQKHLIATTILVQVKKCSNIDFRVL